MNMRSIVTCLIVLTVGCVATVDEVSPVQFDVDTARLAALHTWETRIAPISDECRGIAMASDFVVLDSHALAATCQLATRGTAQACVFAQDWKSASIALDATVGQDAETVAHEIAHVLQWCSTGGTNDVGHADARVWRVFGGYGSNVKNLE